MAAGVLRSFMVQPAVFRPFHHSPPILDEKKKEEEDEEETSEPAEDDDDEEVFVNHVAVDMTNQLLRFADLISRDVRRYFGRPTGEQDSCQIYSERVSFTTSGRLRYYDDLLRLAKSGSPPQDDRLKVADSSLGPLAELFDQKGPTLRPPMNRRHLPLSFWTEPSPCCLLDRRTPELSRTPAEAGDNTHLLYAHALDSSQPDFSDLLANWDQHPDLCPTPADITHLTH